MNDTNKEHIDQLITDCLTGCLDEEGMRVLKEWRIASPEHEGKHGFRPSIPNPFLDMTKRRLTNVFVSG